MMERKFTDDEVVKALECCSKDSMLNCRNCPYEESCNMGRSDMQKDALDLINRQKAEIERLIEEREKLLKECKKCGSKTQKVIIKLKKQMRQTKSEAIKEFAERWKKYWKAQMDVSTNQHQDEIVLRDIDNLVKEMTGENNGN